MINNDDIKNFTNLSDDELRQRIKGAAEAGKISPERLKNALSDTDKIRSIVSKLTPEDIEKFARIIGKENADKMIEKLKN